MGRTANVMLRAMGILLIGALAGCATNGERIDALAAQAHLNRSVLRVGSFNTVIYEQHTSTDDAGPFVIFLDGDGVPWTGGITPNPDPTTRDPLALKLLTKSPVNGAYVARPCYQEIKSEGCTPNLWTAGRYSQSVVQAMKSAIEQIVTRRHPTHLAVVGYSGGGALAVLLAERIPEIDTVITFGANLDTDAWTTYHGYLPLETSLNPARSERVHSFRELHLIGLLDNVVPPQTREAYFKRFSNAKNLVLKTYTHTCCWLQDWNEVSRTIDREIGEQLLSR
ncbi:MAG TPA: hypothetical protein VFS24_00335 [Steroidobacteraceae bacterium]|nr:hypothetical protein [Steroidobacteraceae bacterium]